MTRPKKYQIQIDFTNGNFAVVTMKETQEHIINYFKKGKTFLYEGELQTIEKITLLKL